MLQAARLQDGNVINVFATEYSVEFIHPGYSFRCSYQYKKTFRGTYQGKLEELISSLSDGDYLEFI
jgi:hypothetical protein